MLTKESTLAGGPASPAASYDSIYDATVAYLSYFCRLRISLIRTRISLTKVWISICICICYRNNCIIGWTNGLEQKVCCKLCCWFIKVINKSIYW